MDCCENTKQNMKKGNKENCCENKDNMKGGRSMVKISKSTMLWIIIGILVIATIFLIVKTSSIGTGAVQATGNVVKTAASSASGGMVGGC